MSKLEESDLLLRISEGDRIAFAVVFTRYYNDLVLFAASFTHQREISEEIVQEVFLKLWENASNSEIPVSLRSYLLKSVQNRCLDWLRHMKVRSHYALMVQHAPVLAENDCEKYLLYSELHSALEQAMRSMPADVAEAFRQNRFDGLTYKEIADKLGLSVRTVEVRISKALQWLRLQLVDFLPVCLLILSLPIYLISSNFISS